MIKTDVLIVGAGPAGLATAISLKRRGYAGRVVVLDKARSPGAHVLSGAVIDPSGFSGVLTEEECARLPVDAHVTGEGFKLLINSKVSFPIPWVPPMMRAKGYPVGSLAKVAGFLSAIAGNLGVEIYHGFAATDLLEEGGRVIGVRTGEKGLDHERGKKRGYLPSEEVRSAITVLAEGASGVLTDRLIARKGLAGRRPQSYALGLKEIIDLPQPKKGCGGKILHTFGYPVNYKTYGGGFVYHMSDSRVAVGYAVGLDYSAPALDPHALFRRFKATRAISSLIAGGRSVAYGAKLIPEGGYYALPRPYSPGALIVGDGAGFVDGLRIKGVHLALQSGCLAAEAIVRATGDIGADYARLLRDSSIYREIKRVRNVHGGFSWNAFVGVMMAGFAWATFGRFPFWMVGSCHRDCEALKPLSHRDLPRVEIPPVTPYSPDRLTDVFLSGARHEENQPSHIKILDSRKCTECHTKYGSPCTFFCPAEVYHFDGSNLEVDFSNCLHCKTCSNKCPFDNIEWNFPQGGDGPRYAGRAL